MAAILAARRRPDDDPRARALARHLGRCLLGSCAKLLRDEFEVVAWELPGHGSDRGPVPDGLTIEDLAARVLAQVDGPFLYAGDSVGGLVGLQLLLDAPERVIGAVLCCTGAKIGDDAGGASGWPRSARPVPRRW